MTRDRTAETDGAGRMTRDRTAETDWDGTRWMHQANCANIDPAVFFIERGTPGTQAKAICARCTVRAQCLEYALETPEKYGVWGGLTERERRPIRRARNRARLAGAA